MVGRASIVAALVSQLPEKRFITIVGSGGIGKTTVALAAADELSASYRDGARFIDLGPVADHPLGESSTWIDCLSQKQANAARAR
jgi:predicted ATPase